MNTCGKGGNDDEERAKLASPILVGKLLLSYLEGRVCTANCAAMVNKVDVLATAPESSTKGKSLLILL